jgi:hypothetical protein
MSQIYNQLVSYEKKLRLTLITKTVTNNSTSATSQYRLRSYRLLSHAEIEHFIENKVLSKISIEKRKWQTKGIVTNCLANLLAYHKVEYPNVSSRLADISTKNDISFRVGLVIANFETRVKRNNGIKEVDIIPMLISIGIDYTKISQTLLNNLSSFGHNRGNTAHNSSKVQQLINPSDEMNMVQHIISELRDVDKLIDQIK